jgi:hypothetical protein
VTVLTSFEIRTQFVISKKTSFVGMLETKVKVGHGRQQDAISTICLSKSSATVDDKEQG